MGSKLSSAPFGAHRGHPALLIEHFIRKFNALETKEINRIFDNAIKLLMRYNSPGNIRELENFIEYAFVLCRGETINSHHLSKEIQTRATKDTYIRFVGEQVLSTPGKVHNMLPGVRVLDS